MQKLNLLAATACAASLVCPMCAQGIAESNGEPANNTATGAEAGSCNAQHYGSLGPSDIDLWAFTVSTAGRVVIWTTERGVANTCTDTTLELRGTDGTTVLASNDDEPNGSGLFSRIAFDLPAAGTYYVAVAPFGPDTGDYALDITCDVVPPRRCASFTTATPEIEPNDDCVTAQPSAACEQHINTLQFAGDVDFYSFTLGTSSIIELETYADTTTTGTAVADTKLWLYAAGDCTNPIAEADDGGTGLYSRLTASLSAGTYYVEVSDWLRGDTGDYRLTIDSIDGEFAATALESMPFAGVDRCGGSYVTAPAESEPNDDCATAQTTSCCEEHINTLQLPGDSDFYGITLSAATTVTWETHLDTSVTGSARDDTRFWLYAAGDCTTPIAEDDDGGAGRLSKLTITLAPGTYYLEVSDWIRAAPGDYRLTIDCADAPGTCFGSNGREMLLDARVGERPRKPSQWTIDVINVPSAGTAAMLVGFARLDPYIDLSLIGMPGCSFGVTPSFAAIPMAPTVAGEAEFGLPLGGDPGLVLHLQATAIDGGANALGVITSRNRARVVVGNEFY